MENVMKNKKKLFKGGKPQDLVKIKLWIVKKIKRYPLYFPYIYNNTNTKLDWDSVWNALFWLKWRTKNQKTTVSPNQLHSNSSSKKFFFPRKKRALGDRILQFICLLLFLITSRFHLRYVSWRRGNNRNYFFLGLLFICFFKKTKFYFRLL